MILNQQWAWSRQPCLCTEETEPRHLGGINWMALNMDENACAHVTFYHLISNYSLWGTCVLLQASNMGPSLVMRCHSMLGSEPLSDSVWTVDSLVLFCRCLWDNSTYMSPFVLWGQTNSSPKDVGGWNFSQLKPGAYSIYDLEYFLRDEMLKLSPTADNKLSSKGHQNETQLTNNMEPDMCEGHDSIEIVRGQRLHFQNKVVTTFARLSVASPILKQ